MTENAQVTPAPVPAQIAEQLLSLLKDFRQSSPGITRERDPALYDGLAAELAGADVAFYDVAPGGLRLRERGRIEGVVQQPEEPAFYFSGTGSQAVIFRGEVLAFWFDQFAPLRWIGEPERGATTTTAAPPGDPLATLPLPVVPNPFQDGAGYIASSHPAYALVQAIHHAASRQNWTDHRGETPPTHVMLTNGGKGAMLVEFRGDDANPMPPPEVMPTLWAQVGRLDDLTSDALLVLLAVAEHTGSGPDRAFWIRAETILDARELQPMRRAGEPGNWRHGHRREDRLRAGRALAQLEQIWIKVLDVQVTRGTKGAKPQTINLESRALAMTDKISQQELDGSTVFLAARVTFGSWAARYWELGLRQVACLSQKALAYDPYRQQPEKRLAKYLAFHFRFDAHHGRAALHRTVATLLQEAELRPDPARAARIRSRLEKALAQFARDGVIAKWGYTVEAGRDLPAHNWFPYWLRATVWLTPPPRQALAGGPGGRRPVADAQP